MTKKEFIDQLNNNYYIRVYNVTRVTERGHKGWRVSYANRLGESTVSQDKQIDIWKENLEDAYTEFSCDCETIQDHEDRVNRY